MATKIELYQQLREHIADEAAQVIAEEVAMESVIADKLDALPTRDELENKIERLRASTFRTLLFFFVPMWVGVYATLAAIVLRGSP